jgi:hypothetical protein
MRGRFTTPYMTFRHYLNVEVDGIVAGWVVRLRVAQFLANLWQRPLRGHWLRTAGDRSVLGDQRLAAKRPEGSRQPGGRLELHCALVRRQRSGSYRKAELRCLRSLGDRFCPWLSIASPPLRTRRGPGLARPRQAPVPQARAPLALRSSALTVCSARGWDREVERHQATRQRLLQLLEQLGESEPR